jgi:hypothetical protein
MRYLVRVIDVIPKDILKNGSKWKMFHVKPNIQVLNESRCGLWLIFFK